jgi:SAM-dependent methyltransferase
MPLRLKFVDLGTAPPSNAFVSADDLHRPEPWLPLRVLVCEHCWLVQTDDVTSAESLFAADYVYFSSYSSGWLAHAKRFVHDMQAQFALDSHSMVVELAANDGYLLQYVKALGIPCLGIEPTAGTAAAARAKGLCMIERFFGAALADELVADGLAADLIVANNVLAHVPAINDFVAGIRTLLKPEGLVSFEFPSLLSLLTDCQFDTIYHEHFSYLSLSTVSRIVKLQGLTVIDAQALPTHGGSLRVLAARSEARRAADPAPRVVAQLAAEMAAGLDSCWVYQEFQARVERVRNDFIAFLLQAKREGRRLAAYGAAAKGNTLLNFAGVGADLLPYVVDRNPAKQGRYLPGSHIPVLGEALLKSDRPDLILLLPWNLRTELSEQLAYISNWGAKLVVALPRLEVFSADSGLGADDVPCQPTIHS